MRFARWDRGEAASVSPALPVTDDRAECGRVSLEGFRAVAEGFGVDRDRGELGQLMLTPRRFHAKASPSPIRGQPARPRLPTGAPARKRVWAANRSWSQLHVSGSCQ